MKNSRTTAQKNKIWIGGVLLVGLVLMGVLGPVFAPYSYEQQDITAKNIIFSASHILGTDKFGRDIWIRVCMGIRISIQVGLLSTMINLILGGLIGGIIGYRGGKVDILGMRIADMISAIPSLLYMVLIMLVMESKIQGIILGLCISGWVGIARVVRGEMLRLKQTEYCIAARMSGIRDSRIILYHLLPNMKNTILRYVTYMIPEAIFAEAFLSFVGIGLSAPLASLGTMIQDARSQINLYPLQMVYPIIALCLLIVSFQIIGAGLEE